MIKRKGRKTKNRKVSKKPVPKMRVSNRVYPAILCLKTDCNNIFYPTTKRQKYCCKQHQIDQNNDNRDTKAAPGIMLEKIYQHNQRVLKKLWEACDRLKMKCVSIDYLNIEVFYHDYFTHTSINPSTEQTIHWAYFYGIEAYDSNSKTIYIHQRQNL